MKLIIIAAIGKNRELGYNNELIWRIKEDLKFFKEHTKGHNIVMGRKTFESLGGLLPNRHHIIISTSMDSSDSRVDVYRDIESFLESYKDSPEEIYVIGGASIYKAFLPLCDTMHLTEINESGVADAYFPEFNKDDFDREELSSFDEPVVYKHVLYNRKRK